MVGASSPTVVLTRESEDNRSLVEALEKRGVPVREIPCLATRYSRPDRLPKPGFQAVTFSSRRGVRSMISQKLVEHLIPEDVLVAAVGPATTSELANAGIRVDLTADPPEGKVLAQELMKKLPAGSRVVTVRGNLRVGGLESGLSKNEYQVEPLEIYQNTDPGVPALDPFPVLSVLVASPSAGRRLVEKNPWIKQHRFCAIGPTTAAALSKLGVNTVQQLPADPAGWVDTLISEET